MHDIEEKLMTRILWGVEEILGRKEEIIKEVTTTKDASQKFIEVWKSMQQA